MAATGGLGRLLLLVRMASSAPRQRAVLAASVKLGLLCLNAGLVFGHQWQHKLVDSGQALALLL